MKTSQGPTVLHCQESPECWLEDFGEGELVDGRADAELDPLFLETVTIDNANPMKVFVQLGGSCEGVYVKRGTTGFDVVELRDGMSSVPFVCRVVPKRKDFEPSRLEVCEAARSGPYLYPELRDKLLQEREAERTRTLEQHREMVERQSGLKARSGRVPGAARVATVAKARP